LSVATEFAVALETFNAEVDTRRSFVSVATFDQLFSRYDLLTHVLSSTRTNERVTQI